MANGVINVQVEMMEQEAREVLKRLTEHGHSAYMVGGYVRDRMMNRPIRDIDIATSALPEQVAALFPHTVPTGLKHGTVTVVTEHCAFEVTTFRRESRYVQFRRPEKVEFIDDLHEDLQRRDFTINAMAMDADGNVIDPFGGLADARSRLLRCVGSPHERFREDALRMMRCIRFAAEYELEIEPLTWEALLWNAPALRYIAMERIRSELERMIEGTFPYRAMRLLLDSGLMQYFKTDPGWPMARWDAEKRGCLQALQGIQDNVVRWALLFRLMETSAQDARLSLRRLTFPRNKAEQICRPLTFHEWLERKADELAEASGEPAGSEAAPLKRWEMLFKEGAARFGKKTLRQWLSVHRAAQSAAAAGGCPTPPAWQSLIIRHGEEWLREVAIDSLKELAVTGADLLRFHAKAGPWVGSILERLLTDVAQGSVPNRKEPLLQLADKYVREMVNDA